MDDNLKAIIKKDIFVAVISNGSMVQKENWEHTAQKAFDFCTSHTDKPKSPVKKTKKADK